MWRQIKNYCLDNYQDILYNIWYTYSYLIILPVLISLLVGLSIAIICNKYKPLTKFVIPICNILQLVPSLAMFIILLMIGFSLGLVPGVVAITIYSILPIIFNSYSGLESVDSSKGKILGMSYIQELIYIKIPLASPMILTGVKLALINAASYSVLAAMVGADGLGYYIYSSITQRNYYLCIIGIVPIIIISVTIDFILSKVIKNLNKLMLNKA